MKDKIANTAREEKKLDEKRAITPGTKLDERRAITPGTTSPLKRKRDDEIESDPLKRKKDDIESDDDETGNLVAAVRRNLMQLQSSVDALTSYALRDSQKRTYYQTPTQERDLHSTGMPFQSQGLHIMEMRLPAEDLHSTGMPFQSQDLHSTEMRLRSPADLHSTGMGLQSLHYHDPYVPRDSRSGFGFQSVNAPPTVEPRWQFVDNSLTKYPFGDNRERGALMPANTESESENSVSDETKPRKGPRRPEHSAPPADKDQGGAGNEDQGGAGDNDKDQGGVGNEDQGGAGDNDKDQGGVGNEDQGGAGDNDEDQGDEDQGDEDQGDEDQGDTGGSTTSTRKLSALELARQAKQAKAAKDQERKQRRIANLHTKRTFVKKTLD